MIKNLIQKYLSEEERYCLEMHNGLRWYFSIEHPAEQPSSGNPNSFFTKYGFTVLKNIDKIDTHFQDVINFLQKTTPESRESKIIFGKRKVYFKDRLKFVSLSENDMFIYNPKRVCILD